MKYRIYLDEYVMNFVNDETISSLKIERYFVEVGALGDPITYIK